MTASHPLITLTMSTTKIPFSVCCIPITCKKVLTKQDVGRTSSRSLFVTAFARQR